MNNIDDLENNKIDYEEPKKTKAEIKAEKKAAKKAEKEKKKKTK